MFLPHWDFLPSPLGKDCSSLYYWGRNFLPFPTAEGVFFTSPLWLGKEFSSLYYWGRNFLPFITGERIFFPFAPRKESSLLPRCGWGRNFLPFLLGKEFSSLLTGEGISFPSYWGRNFLPFLLGKEFSSLLTGEGIFFPLLLGKKPPPLGKEVCPLPQWGMKQLYLGKSALSEIQVMDVDTG